VYSAVPRVAYGEFMNADSKGIYFNNEVKPNYECRRL
jgi:hypothetical protein